MARIIASRAMELALDAARSAGRRGEVPVGAVLLGPDGAPIATDGNRTRELNDVTAHAEILVIRAAGQMLSSDRLPDCDLFVTLEPCAMCAAAISFARIRRLYFAAPDPKMGAVEHGPGFFGLPTCHHAPEVYSRIGERTSAELLRSFFRARRD